MRLRLLGAASAAALAVAGLGAGPALAGPISGTPANGPLWTTSAGLFAEIAGVSHQLADLDANTFTGLQTFSAGATFSGTITNPDGGTQTSTLNSFAKPVTAANSATAASPAYTFSSPSAGSFGCLYASAASTYDLGSTATAGGSCSNPAFEWTSATATIGKALTVSAGATVTGSTVINGNPLTVKDITGANTVATFAYSASVPTWTLPVGGILKGGTSAALCPDATIGWDFGNTTLCSATGTIGVGTI